MSEQEQQAEQNKDGLIAQIQASRVTFWSLVDALSDEELATQRDTQGWTTADHLIHLALWQNGIAALLRHQPRWAAMGLTDEEYQSSKDADDINTMLRPKYAHLTAQEARQFLHEAEGTLDAALAPLSTEDLLKSYASYQPNEPDRETFVAAYVIGNSFEHYEEHLPWLEAIVRAK